MKICKNLYKKELFIAEIDSCKSAKIAQILLKCGCFTVDTLKNES